MMRFEVVDEVNAATERPTSDVEQVGVGPKSLCHQVVELDLADLVPHAADAQPVVPPGDLLRAQLEVVVVDAQAGLLLGWHAGNSSRRRRLATEPNPAHSA